EGKGDGSMASNLPEPPKDLGATKGKSDTELKDIINDGSEATGMPAFEGALSEDEIQNVIEYLRIL
ncbi:MAG: c-type cytochrome, partial [Candidatus Hydrothermarchaeales archaeon]